MKDYTNIQYGDYLITNYLGHSTWEAHCVKCGHQRTYKTANIKLDRVNGGLCPCSKTGICIGDKFGRLTVLCRDNTFNDGFIHWKCQCTCGNIISVTTKRLKSGNTKSCGCLSRELASDRMKEKHSLYNLSGQRFGKLMVQRLATPEEVINRPPKNRYWYCQCDCGNTHIVATSDLTTGKVASCGCLNSKGEALIQQLLDENNITYCKQYTFADLKDKLPLPFDFAIMDKNNNLAYLIEYDGVQHFNIEKQFNGMESYQYIKSHDKMKDDYCNQHKIPLIRIPYTKYNTLTIKDLTPKG